MNPKKVNISTPYSLIYCLFVLFRDEDSDVFENFCFEGRFVVGIYIIFLMWKVPGWNSRPIVCRFEKQLHPFGETPKISGDL